MTTPRVLICGGRDYADWLFFNKVMYNVIDIYKKWTSPPDEYGNYLPDVVIISGAARGADQMAIEWAIVNWCLFEEYPANWKRHGRKAGPIRNQQMIDEGKPDLVIAFPGGEGTKDMIQRAKKAGIEIIEVSKT